MDDSFSESLETFNKRPVAVNEKGQNIYKVLEDEELCFSNISREDIEVFVRS